MLGFLKRPDIKLDTTGLVPMIDICELDLVYPNGHQALHDIHLQINKGEFVFLVGTTGSGKSSILKLLYRELAPSRGSVLVGGLDLGELSRKEVPYLRRSVGVIFQDFRLLNKTAAENVAYALEITGTPRYQVVSRRFSSWSVFRTRRSDCPPNSQAASSSE